ncbi:MAG: Mur ligase family protein [Thermomicrobiales bacterium]
MATSSLFEDLALAPVERAVQRWQRDTMMAGMLPVIGIAGTGGKTTVVRMLDAILSEAGLRTATWTDLGVEIRGRRQKGELSGWSLALSRLAEGTIDVAIQELHWSTIHAVGLPAMSYPVLALTNLTGGQAEGWNPVTLRNATNAATRVADAAHPAGILVINGDDYSLVDAATTTKATPVVVARSKESPSLSRQLKAERPAVWNDDHGIVISAGRGAVQESLIALKDMPATMHGSATFQISNAMSAAAIAASIGIGTAEIQAGLRGFRSDPELMPGSFNHWENASLRAVVSQMASSWQTRLVLRSINPGAKRRQITVLGDLATIEIADVVETGRVLGRYPGAILLYENVDQQRLDAFRHGITANEYPPLIVHLPTERKAINRALRTIREDDVLLMLPSGDPMVACRAITRHMDAAAD